MGDHHARPDASGPPPHVEAAATTGIEVTNVRRTFGSVVAVDDISLTARPGEVTGLVGPNGAGKTTLLLMLATLLRPDGGTIRIDGLDPMTDTREVRRRIGWMPDGFGTWDALTVREVLQTVAAAYEIPAVEARTRTDDVLSLLHLDDLADQRARVLSRGQQQRLGMARVLVHRPSVLLLDEPASGLDPRSRIELRDVVRGLAAEGRTVLVSSHILTELQEMADRAVIVAGGRSTGQQLLAGTGAGAPPSAASWRITTLDRVRLEQLLVAQGVSYRPELGAVEVPLAGEEAAARLLADLVGAGVRVTTFAPSVGALETAYLAATQERR